MRPNFKWALLIVVAVALSYCSGCARFSTTQTEVRNEATVTITTKAQAWTLFSSKSALAKWKAEQSEGTQGASVGSLEQQADSTVVVDALKELNEFVSKVKP
jgi:predicted Fe-S protein YdhL (DUF1289 family)